MPRAMGGCGGSCGAHERKAQKPRQLLHGAALWAESPGRSRVVPGKGRGGQAADGAGWRTAKGRGRLGHGPGRLWPWPRRPGVRGEVRGTPGRRAGDVRIPPGRRERIAAWLLMGVYDP